MQIDSQWRSREVSDSLKRDVLVYLNNLGSGGKELSTMIGMGNFCAYSDIPYGFYYENYYSEFPAEKRIAAGFYYNDELSDSPSDAYLELQKKIEYPKDVIWASELITKLEDFPFFAGGLHATVSEEDIVYQMKIGNDLAPAEPMNLELDVLGFLRDSHIFSGAFLFSTTREYLRNTCFAVILPIFDQQCTIAFVKDSRSKR